MGLFGQDVASCEVPTVWGNQSNGSYGVQTDSTEGFIEDVDRRQAGDVGERIGFIGDAVDRPLGCNVKPGSGRSLIALRLEIFPRAK
jgi:hypothetical protein